MIEPQESQPEIQRTFDELTLWEALWLFTYHPVRTLQRLFEAIALPSTDKKKRRTFEETLPLVPPAPLPDEPSLAPLVAAPIAEIQPEPEPSLWNTVPEVDLGRFFNLKYGLLLWSLLAAMLWALSGADSLWQTVVDPFKRNQPDATDSFWIASILAGLVYIVWVGVFSSYEWWWALGQRLTAGKDEPPTNSPRTQGEDLLPSSFTEEGQSGNFEPEPAAVPAPNTTAADNLILSLIAGVERHAIRIALIPVAAVLAYLAYAENVRYDPNDAERVLAVELTRTGIIAWFGSIALWFALLGLDLNTHAYRLYRWLTGEARIRLPRLTWRPDWQHGVLIVIMLLAGYFRLHDLSGVPPDMTSDHIEKLLDSVKVYDGQYAVFFENNGGREAFQMYVVAGLVRYFGQDFSFDTLKLATVIEGMITVFLGYWFGIVMMGRETAEDREMGVWVGLAFAVLLAISAWHVMLSRLALRIVLTPLTTMLVVIFLVRGMRYNRRLDFVWVGFWLGAGFYFYQSNRMLPILVVAGTGIAILGRLLQWRQVLRYVINLACVVIMAVVIYVPMYRYGQEFPESYWNRTRGRLFGENAFVRVNPNTGVEETYEPSLREQIDRFLDESDKFTDNYIDALEMWSWSGDGAWISNGGNRPALDQYTDALFILGLAAWIVVLIKKRDVALLIVPVGILIMLLPTALTLAYQVENPSFTRASGTIPFVFLLAAYPLAQMAYFARRVTKYSTVGIGMGLLLALPLIGVAGRANFDNFYHIYRDSYARSWKPYSEFAAPLHDFATGQGSYGNAFLIAYPHWLDHRIIAVSAGDSRWNNGLVAREDVYTWIVRNDGTPYEYDPTEPLFFMYHGADRETSEWLKQRFPGGIEYTQLINNRPELNFNYYIAPPGYGWLKALVRDRAITQGLILSNE